MNFSNVIKVTIYVKDMKNFATLNEIYKSNFSEPYPAREVVEVSELPKSGDVEISLIAMI
jgi:2-iminobutanoate/2-iminopropanoate deaminase